MSLLFAISASFQKQLKHLSDARNSLDKASLKLNLKNCQIARRQIKFSSFLVSSADISPNPEKVEAVARMLPSKNARETRRYLGRVGFFRRHIKDFAKAAAPLTNLKGRTNQSFGLTQKTN